MDAFSHNCLTWFPKPWCMMEISHPTRTQKVCEDTCGKAEGCTNPLAFRGVLQVLSCWLWQWIKEPKSGSQGQRGHLPKGRVEGAALCFRSPVLCWHNQYVFSNSHMAGVMPMTFPPEITTGMTLLLMTYWWRQKSDINNVFLTFQRAKDCARTATLLSPLS